MGQSPIIFTRNWKTKTQEVREQRSEFCFLYNFCDYHGEDARYRMLDASQRKKPIPF
ncbi:MAG: hypothetical protein WBC40_02425 [Halobacteriota archaeon]